MQSRGLGLVSLIAAASCMLAACEFQRAQNASDAKKGLVGVSRETVLQCMGSPARTAYAGYTEVWSYDSGNNRTDSFGSASGWVNGAGNVTAFGSSTSSTRACKIDLVMQGGFVTRVNYSGDTGGWFTKGEQCGFAVENCMANLNSSPTEPGALSSPTVPTQTASTMLPAPSDDTPTQLPKCTKQELETAKLAEKQGFHYRPGCTP